MDPKETIAQLSLRGWGGALAYCGVKKVAFNSTTNTLSFTVNGRRGFKTFIMVKLEANDTYTVTLLSMYMRASKHEGNMSDERKDVYADELQTIFEAMYDNHIKTANQGFIPLD